MSSKVNDAPDPLGLAEEVIAAIQRAEDSHCPPSRHDWARWFPELRSQLDEYFNDLDNLDSWLRPLRTTAHAQLSEQTVAPEGPLERGPVLPTSLGGYELLEVIGKGGMGVVYKARQQGPERLVALKVMQAGALHDPVDVRRFRHEADLVAALDHPNIVPVYQVATEGGTWFFSMKLVPGGSLAGALHERGAPLPPAEAARLVATVARAVHHAHQRGVLHRDLKPANILLSEAGQPLVADFGLARKLDRDPTLTQQGAIVGTPAYMAPEQARALPVLTTAADVHGLGAILYHLLAGEPPFRAATVVETLQQVQSSEPRSPRSLRRGLSRDLEAICLKCLEKEPNQRYPSAEALAEDLERWLRGETVQARRVGWLVRLTRWCRRNPALAAVAVGVCLLAGAASIGWLLAHRANAGERAQRKRAETGEAAERSQRKRAEASEEEARRYLYAAQLKVAQHAWETGNVARALDVLERQRPRNGGKDLRGPEWGMLWRLCHQARFTLTGHADAVRAVALDGERVISVGTDRTVRWWDSNAPRPRDVLRLPGKRLLHPVLSRDGRFLAFADERNEAHVWDLRKKEKWRSFPVEKSPIRAIALSASGQALLVGLGNGTIALHELSGKRQTKTFAGRPEPVTALALSPDGQVLAAGSVNGALKMWQTATGEERAEKRRHKGPIWDLAFTADGALLASGGYDTVIRLWEVKTARLAGELREQLGPILSLAFAPKGATLASSSGDHTVCLWDVRAQELQAKLRGHTRTAACVAWFPNGAQLASGSSDQTVKLWAASEREDRLPVHGTFILGLAFSPDSKVLATTSTSLIVRTWTAATGKVRSLLEGHTSTVYGATFTPDGRSLITSGIGEKKGKAPRGEVRVWDVARAEQRRAYTGLPGVVYTQALTRDGKVLAAGCATGVVKLWELADGKELPELRCATAEVRSLAFSPDGKLLAVGTSGSRADRPDVGDVSLWDWRTGVRKAVLKGHTSSVWALAFSPDGKQLASGAVDSTVRLWDLTSGEGAVLARLTGAVRALAYSPDGRRLASGGTDGVLRVWDLGTREEVLSVRDFSSAIWALAFSPDGQALATGHENGRVKLWRANVDGGAAR